MADKPMPTASVPSEPLDLEAIEKRAEAATEGPWVTHCCEANDPEGCGPEYRCKGYALARCSQNDVTVEVYSPPGTYIKRDARVGDNAEFIAHARTDVPALCRRVRELEEALRRVSLDYFEANREREALRATVKASRQADDAAMDEMAERMLNGEKLLRQALEAVCSLKCPSVWRTADHPKGQPHGDECEAIRAFLAPVEVAQGGETPRLADVAGSTKGNQPQRSAQPRSPQPDPPPSEDADEERWLDAEIRDGRPNIPPPAPPVESPAARHAFVPFYSYGVARTIVTCLKQCGKPASDPVHREAEPVRGVVLPETGLAKALRELDESRAPATSWEPLRCKCGHTKDSHEYVRFACRECNGCAECPFFTPAPAPLRSGESACPVGCAIHSAHDTGGYPTPGPVQG